MPSLASILTAARAGSINYANALFEAGGWATRTDDSAALATRARLLKDAALRASGPERKSLLHAAAQAYAAADALRAQPHTRINEATMRFLAGDREGARALALALPEWMAAQPRLLETAYFIAATRAEAHLLCGDVARAAQAMREACAANPDGWSDRATTLRQLALICDDLGVDHGWLDPFRPPVSLNYAGHLGLAAQVSPALRETVDRWMDERSIGFGFGALAAGGDILLAEAILARGGELHVVLPIGIDAFVAQSITPYEPEWYPRFSACLDAAQSVQCVTSLSGAYEPLATQLAADVAMGAAALNARRLHSTAWQLLLVDDAPGRFGAGLGTQRIGERWRDKDRQHCVVAPRTAPVPPSSQRPAPEGRADRRLATMLLIAFDGIDRCDEAGFADAVDTVIAPFRAACAALPIQPDLTMPVGNALMVAFADPDAAWAYAQAVLALPSLALPLRIAGHHGLVHWLASPPALVGRATADCAAIGMAAMPGVLTASETMASALCINRSTEIVAEHVGEAGDIRLYALSPTGRSIDQ